MTRAVISLAIRTGIPASVWANEPPRYIETALDLLSDDAPPPRPARGEQMSG